MLPYDSHDFTKNVKSNTHSIWVYTRFFMLLLLLFEPNSMRREFRFCREIYLIPEFRFWQIFKLHTRTHTQTDTIPANFTFSFPDLWWIFGIYIIFLVLFPSIVLYYYCVSIFTAVFACSPSSSFSAACCCCCFCEQCDVWTNSNCNVKSQMEIKFFHKFNSKWTRFLGKRTYVRR